MASSHAGIIRTPDSVGTCQDSDGGEGRHCPSPLFSRNLRLTHSSKVSGLGLGAMSCLVRQPLALCGFHGQRLALHVIDAKLGAGVHAKVELGQVTVKMLGVDMLINAN